ncbi:unnamed protein product [Adineta steineri]|uniref:Cullin N-terminal domain-containing protein n=1 Tax=Adineta steineri TaxID=433720 RepID=A0A819SYI8_9BILA|nr:unnamed protein product [Adineta steineri]
MASNSASDENLIRILETVDRIFCSKISNKQLYLELHALIYNYCAGPSPHFELNLRRTASDREKYLINAGGSSPTQHINGGELYYRMENYLVNYAKNLYELLMLIWQEIVLKPISNRLTNICFDIIKTKRNNHLVTNIQLIEDVAQSYMSFNFHENMILWVNNERTAISPFNIYTELFEKPILQKTKEFHQIEANKYLSSESVIEYLTKASFH